jgi:hypothetical protein
LLVEAVQLPGTEPTASPREISARVTDAIETANETVVELAGKLAATVKRLEDLGRRPDHLAFEFGLSFSVQGNVIIMSSGAGASLKVTVSYDRPVNLAPDASDSHGQRGGRL